MATDDSALRLPAGSIAPGARLHCKRWSPAGAAKAAILISHGYAEHLGRYEHVAAALTAAGYDVFAIDHWGHGQSDGERGYAPAFSVFLDGVEALVEKANAELPGRKKFLLGHSMGALIAANYLTRDDKAFAGAALSGPSIKAVEEPSAAVLFIGRVLSKIAPKAGLIQLDPALVSRDPAVVKAYIDDPLVYCGKMSARLGAALIDAMRSTLQNAPAIGLPILIMHGSQDGLAAPEGARMLNARISSPDKTLKIYDGFFHEIFNDPGKENVIADMIAWLDAHC
ncbi:MAG: lysophospholipase [Parvularculaceae bacterium]|nr:lysophospholipase [Parvularculaceae bacterium]